jgi:hypothetical protein
MPHTAVPDTTVTDTTGPVTTGADTTGPVAPPARRTIHAGVTSVSWIPSEAVPGLQAAAFAEAGPLHYDAPPPDRLGDLDRWAAEDRFRFANGLRVRVTVADGPDGPRIVDAAYLDGSRMGSTTLALGRRRITFAAVALPELRATPEVLGDRVRFVQTSGGRTALPGPRRVAHPPYVQLRAPLVWTTLALTVHADGTVEHEVVGASRFPRHWIYDGEGRLVQKVGLADFDGWYRTSFGRHTPWGDEESPALVTAVESALERELSRAVMAGGPAPAVSEHRPGEVVVAQGESGGEVLLVLDGVLDVDVDGRIVAEVGPGAVLGERAALEGGRRTARLRARTRCRVAAVPADRLDRAALVELRRDHRREGASPLGPGSTAPPRSGRS